MLFACLCWLNESQLLFFVLRKLITLETTDNQGDMEVTIGVMYPTFV